MRKRLKTIGMESKKETKFKIGDKVKVVNYGHLIWQNKTNQDAERKFHKDNGIPYQELPIVSDDGKTQYLDLHSDLVGKEGVVADISSSGDYALSGLSKYAWYSEIQLELVK